MRTRTQFRVIGRAAAGRARVAARRARRAAQGAALGIALAMAFACASGAAFAAQGERSAAATAARTQPSAPGAPPALTAGDLGAWLDGYLPYALRQANVAGAVVVVVKDGAVLVEKGYGYADVASRRPVDPETTLFRPGSISKLFTWTAVMQLVEAGKLDLDADVNGYLDFKVPPFAGRPVTLRNLMTHTGGFEEHGKGLFGRSEKALIPLARYEREDAPKRIFPPGVMPAYSNYGAGLAGYIVERASGEPFEAYIERHIFAPLGMKHATFRQPLPDAIKADMSSGYVLGSGPRQYFEYVNPQPAGALSASGGDIARFMMAHLDDGRFAGAQILAPATARLMHATAFRSSPAINGMTLGFFEADRNGHRVIEHGGDLTFFHSDLYLVLDQHVGVFLSLNSAGAGAGDIAIRSQIFRDFMDRYYPRPSELPARAPGAAADAARVAGLYELTRRGETTILAVQRIVEQLNVRADAHGDISVPLLDALTGSPPRTWREIAPLVWRETNGQSQIAAVTRNGRIVALTTDDLPAIALLQPTPPGLRQSWLAPALVAAIGALITAVLAWPIGALVRRRYKAKFALTGARATLYRVVRVTCIIDLIFLFGWTAMLATVGSDITRGTSALDPWFRILQIVAGLGLIGAAAAVVNLVVVWADRTRSWWAKASNLALVLAFGVVTWLEFAINAFAFSLNY